MELPHRDANVDDPTATEPVRRGIESDEQAAERGATDKVIVSLLFQGGLRRSEAAQLAWADVTDATDGNGVLVTVRRSKTDQEGERADVRHLKNGCAHALRLLRDRLTVRASGMRPAADALVLGGLNGQSIAGSNEGGGTGTKSSTHGHGSSLSPPRGRTPGCGSGVLARALKHDRHKERDE